MNGLSDRPGAGRRSRLTGEERSRIIALVPKDPPGKLLTEPDGVLQAEDVKQGCLLDAGCLRPSQPRSWRDGASPQPALAEAESESEDVASEHRALFGEATDRPRFGDETESRGS